MVQKLHFTAFLNLDKDREWGLWVVFGINWKESMCIYAISKTFKPLMFRPERWDRVRIIETKIKNQTRTSTDQSMLQQTANTDTNKNFHTTLDWPKRIQKNWYNKGPFLKDGPVVLELTCKVENDAKLGKLWVNKFLGKKLGKFSPPLRKASFLSFCLFIFLS